MKSNVQPEDGDIDLAKLRSEIRGLVAKNATAMVQNAIDAVNEGGQYQALKYLFEIIGLYPPPPDEGHPVEESLAARLLQCLGIEDTAKGDANGNELRSIP